MATPISNTGSSTISHNRSVRGDDNPGKGHARSATEEGSASVAGDSVSVSAAAEVLSQEPVERTQGVIQSAEQASKIAQGLKSMFADNVGQALAAHAKGISPDMMAVLKAG